MPIYVVKPGDTLSAIAQRYGISPWQKLYNDPSNASFRNKRPNPNLIYPGDVLNIPTAVNAATADYVIAVIDGTGPGDENKYAASMQNSFCKQLEMALGKDVVKYQRGPSWLGMEVEAQAKAAYRELKDKHLQQSGIRLMLAGYSRGGSAAIMAAELLERDGIEIDSMFLFDAVARHKYPGGEVIPANVRFSRHARRDVQALMVLKYEGTFSDIEIAGIGIANTSNPMRPTFGNTGLTWRGSGDHQIAKAFAGSHGALGGVGWSFVTEDPVCQQQVATWMNKHLASRGVPARLKSLPIAPGRAAVPTGTALITGLALDLLLLAKHSKSLSGAGRVP